jgi:hypothetical protein
MKEVGFFLATSHDDDVASAPFLDIVRRMISQTGSTQGPMLGSQTRRLLAATSIPKTLAQVFDKHRTSLEPWIPELRQDAKPVEPPRGPEFRKRILAFLIDTARLIPAVFAVEDLHLADEETLEIFRELASAPPEDARRMLLIGSTWGDLPPGHGLTPLLSLFRSSGRILDVTLQGLKSIEVAELIRSMLQMDRSTVPLQKRIITECAGNPLFVEELMKLLIEEKAIQCETTRYRTTMERPEEFRFPASLAECYVRRLSHLSQEARRVLAVLATLRRPTDIDSLVSAGGFERHRIGETLVEGERKGFLRKQIEGDRVAYKLRHPAMREAVLSTSLAGSRSIYRGERGLREVLRMSGEFHAETSLELLYRRVLEAAAVLSGAERGFLMARDADGECRVAAIRRFDSEKLLGPAFRDWIEKARQVSGPHRTVVGGETAEPATSNPEGLGLRSTIFVPLVAGSENLGALCLDSSLAGAPFAEDDLRIVTELASQAAWAVRALLRTPAAPGEEPAAPSRSLENVELSYIRQVLAHTKGNLSQASRILDMPYVTLWRKVKKFHLVQK